MRGFTSVADAQRFLVVHGIVLNLFRIGRHLLRAVHHCLLRARAFRRMGGRRPVPKSDL